MFLVTAFTTTCTDTLSLAYRSTEDATPRTRQAFPVTIVSPRPPCPPFELDNIMGTPIASYATTWCEAQAVPQYHEFAEDIQSYMIGSSWNVLILILMFERITS